MRHSPHRRSPLSKLSHAATAAAAGLATAAGALEGAASGLVDSASHAVTAGGQLSHAVAAKASTKAENAVARAESARRSPDKVKRTPEKRRAGRRAPGRGGVRDRIHQFDSASQSNAMEGRRRDEDVGRRQQRARRQGRDGHEEKRRGEGGWPRRRRDDNDEDGTAKDEERDKKAKASPKRTSDKENAPNRREGRQRRSPPFRHKKRERRAENESETKQEGEAETDENVDIAELNRAAVAGPSNHDSGATLQAGTTPHAKGRSPRKEARTRKREMAEQRDPDEHPLLQSPLRKHMKVVRASACSNATGTVVKEPFPLVPPGMTGNSLAAVAGWNEGGIGAETARDERLGELGAVTGSVPLAAAIPAHPDSVDEGEESTGEALDLLTSAAFLFRHSRRNLG